MGRHGKYLVIGLDRDWLLIHLKMSGRLVIAPPGTPPEPHAHLVLVLAGGDELRLVDPRKFGRVYLVADPGVVLGALGPDALDGALDEGAFRALLSRRRGRMKPLLLNQGFIAGLGNIYADEALWAARIHPLAPATDVTGADADGLLAAIRRVLHQAIAAGGTTLADGGYLGLDGRPGRMAPRLKVYRRTGARCPRCRSQVQRLVVAGRGTHFCPGCQAPPPES